MNTEPRSTKNIITRRISAFAFSAETVVVIVTSVAAIAMVTTVGKHLMDKYSEFKVVGEVQMYREAMQKFYTTYEKYPSELTAKEMALPELKSSILSTSYIKYNVFRVLAVAGMLSPDLFDLNLVIDGADSKDPIGDKTASPGKYYVEINQNSTNGSSAYTSYYMDLFEKLHAGKLVPISKMAPYAYWSHMNTSRINGGNTYFGPDRPSYIEIAETLGVRNASSSKLALSHKYSVWAYGGQMSASFAYYPVQTSIGQVQTGIIDSCVTLTLMSGCNGNTYSYCCGWFLGICTTMCWDAGPSLYNETICNGACRSNVYVADETCRDCNNCQVRTVCANPGTPIYSQVYPKITLKRGSADLTTNMAMQAAALSSKAAQNIDDKIDDGHPITGFFMAENIYPNLAADKVNAYKCHTGTVINPTGTADSYPDPNATAAQIKAMKYTGNSSYNPSGGCFVMVDFMG